MKNWILRIGIWFFLSRQDRDVYWQASRMAEAQIDLQDDTSYYGGTKHAIAYERIRTLLIKEGYAKEDITGAVIHLAISVKYLLSRQ